MSLTTWEYNGKTFELDLGDADTAERYEKAFDTMADQEKTLPKDGNASTRIRAYCNLFIDLYDLLFYPGAGREILPKDSIFLANESYKSFLEFAQNQVISTQNFFPAMQAKYSPNRAQRRAKK